MFSSLPFALRVTSWFACSTVIGMILIFFATSVGQDPLQFVHPPAEYSRILLANPGALRATVGLDNFFIVFYTATFVLLGSLLDRRGSPPRVLRVALGALLFLGFLDMVENFHFMTMLASAEQGIVPSSTEISFQVWESTLKFHVGYLGLFLLGLAMPKTTAGERLLANLSIFVQLPVGILIYIVPHAIAVPLVFVRFTYFVAATILVGAVFGREEVMKSDEGGSGVPA